MNRMPTLEEVCRFIEAADDEQLQEIVGEIIHSSGLHVKDPSSVCEGRYRVLGLSVAYKSPTLVLGDKEE